MWLVRKVKMGGKPMLIWCAFQKCSILSVNSLFFFNETDFPPSVPFLGRPAIFGDQGFDVGLIIGVGDRDGHGCDIERRRHFLECLVTDWQTFRVQLFYCVLHCPQNSITMFFVYAILSNFTSKNIILVFCSGKQKSVLKN